MNKQAHHAFTYESSKEVSFDDLMARLQLQITHHSLTQCGSLLPSIVSTIEALCQHPETDLFPSQQQVLLKMQHLWKTRLFQLHINTQLH